MLLAIPISNHEHWKFQAPFFFVSTLTCDSHVSWGMRPGHPNTIKENALQIRQARPDPSRLPCLLSSFGKNVYLSLNLSRTSQNAFYKEKKAPAALGPA